MGWMYWAAAAILFGVGMACLVYDKTDPGGVWGQGLPALLTGMAAGLAVVMLGFVVAIVLWLIALA
ncbi:MAG TPA: hypothetical protein VFW46_21010 [Stellaceae bacterium]|nr:hypothetical protein [Stellaceae bacterium]